jgi:small subunit ribosomal protein S6
LRHYELVTILSPMLNQDQAAEAWGRIKDFITNREGEIVREHSWGTRRLAYPIRKGSYNFLEGSYYLTQFSTERSFNRELETFLRLDERVLRSLVVTTGPPSPAPVAVSPPVAAEEQAPVAAAGVEVEEAPTVVTDMATEEVTAEEAGPVAAEEPVETEVEESPEEAPVSEVGEVEASEESESQESPEEAPVSEVAREETSEEESEVEEETTAEVVVEEQPEERSDAVSEEDTEPEEERL